MTPLFLYIITDFWEILCFKVIDFVETLVPPATVALESTTDGILNGLFPVLVLRVWYTTN